MCASFTLEWNKSGVLAVSCGACDMLLVSGKRVFKKAMIKISGDEPDRIWSVGFQVVHVRGNHVTCICGLYGQ